jgi:hypothetical protein
MMYVRRCTLPPVRAVRKQFYITTENERKLKRLAARDRCTEAALVRRAIDQLPEGEPSLDERIDQRLRELGVTVPERRMTDEEFEAGRREIDELIPKPVGLSQAVWEDREGR